MNTTTITERVARLIAIGLVIGMPATAVTSGLLSTAGTATAHVNGVRHGYPINSPDHGTHI